jgi:adenosine/AMP kinase
VNVTVTVTVSNMTIRNQEMGRGNSMKRINQVLGRSLTVVALALVATVVWAGDLNSPAAPTDSGSAMFTLEDLYNRLNAGTPGSKRSGGFTDPGGAPGSTMHSLNDLMNKAPAADTAGAAPAEVVAGKKFWGLKTGQWGPQTGVMTNVGAQNLTPGTASQTISQGFHDGTGKVAGAPNLVTGNIKAGTTIFGVTGDSNVVNTSSGNATAGEILLNRNAWVGGQQIIGTRMGGVVLKPGGTFSAAKRWYDNGDGTITDTTSGLIWLKNVDQVTASPTVFCASNSFDLFILMGTLGNGIAGLSDGSAPGDWRVPTAKEMQRLTSGTEAVLFATPQMFIGIADRIYWTVTRGSGGSEVKVFSFAVNLFADRSKNLTAHTCYVMPVRSNY